MKKRILSSLLALVMVMSLLPATAFADLTDMTSGSGAETGPYSVSSDTQLIQSRIDALPGADELDMMDEDELQAVSDQARDILDELDELDRDEYDALDLSKLDALMDWFQNKPETLVEPEETTVSDATALENALQSDSTTIKLGADITASIVIPEGKTITLDLGECTLTNEDGSDTITNHGTLTVTGTGTVQNTTNGKTALLNDGTAYLNGGTFIREDQANNSYYTVVNQGDMTVDGATISNTSIYASCLENGWNNTGDVKGVATLKVVSGEISGGLNAIKNDAGGDLKVEGGTITNSTQYAIMNWNTAKISGGEIICTADKDSAAAVYNSAYETDENSVGQLTISGGELTTTGGTTYALDNRSEATISGDAKLTGASSAVQSMGSGAVTTITGGTLIGTKYYAVTVKKVSKLEISGGTLSSSGSSSAYVVRVSDAGTEAVITGGSFTNEGSGTIGKATVYVGSSSKVDIQGGEFSGSSQYAVHNNGGTLTISGGEFTSPNSAVYVNNSASANTSISGGSFTSTNGTSPAIIKVKTEKKDVGSLVVSGGVFSSDVEDYVDAGNKVVTNGAGSFSVIVDTATAAAKINENYYKTLADAIANAVDGDTVTLLKNTATEPVIIAKSITIDLGGHELEIKTNSKNTYGFLFTAGDSRITNGTITDTRSAGNDTGNWIIALIQLDTTLTTDNVTMQTYYPNTMSCYNYLIRVSFGSSLTVNEGTVLRDMQDGETAYSTYGAVGIGVNGGDMAKYGMTSLTVNDATIDVMAFAIAGNGTADNTKIEIHGGDIKSDGTAVFHPQVGDLTVTGGTITGANGIQYCGAGHLDISGGTITASAPYTEFPTKPSTQGDGSANDGAAVSVISRGGGYQDGDSQTMNITISGGDLISQNNAAISVYRLQKVDGSWTTNSNTTLQNYLNSLSITGGTLIGSDQKGVLEIDAAAKNEETGKSAVSVSGGNFSHSVKEYVVEEKNAELEKSSGAAPFSYTTVEEALKNPDSDVNITILSDGTKATDTVTMKYGNGTADVTIKVEQNATLTLPTDLTREGYTFGDWYNNNEKVTFYIGVGGQTVTLTAKWTANNVAVSFNANGGEVETGNTSVAFGLAYGELPTPTRTGYTFDGWYTAADGGNKVEADTTVSAASAHTLYAHWTINQYTITFENGDGSTISVITQDYNTEVVAPADPTKTGYTFTGWDKEIPTAMPAEDMTITAQWEINTYTVTFEDEFGVVDPTTVTINSGETVTLPTLSKDGYTFLGWKYSDGIPTSDTLAGGREIEIYASCTFIAHWGETLAEDVEIVSGEHEITTAVPGHATEDETAAIHNTAEAVATLTEQGLETVVTNQAEGITSAAQADQRYQEFVSSADAQKVTIVIESSLDIQVKGATVTPTLTSVTVGITPKYVVKATTASSLQEMTPENTVELIQKTDLAVKDDETEPVTISMPLPSALAGFSSISVKHTTKSGSIFYYPCEITGGTLSFVNPHGFSDFELVGMSDSVPVHVVGPNGEGDLTYSIGTIGQELTIELTTGANVPAGKSWRFNGWNITASKEGEQTITIATAMKVLTLDIYTEMARLAADGYTIQSDGVTPGLYTPSSGSGSSGTPSYSVSVSSAKNGSVSVSDKTAKKGDTVTITVKPSKGYELDELTVTDKNGNELKLKAKGDNQYTFTMPAGKVTVEAAFSKIVEKPTTPSINFTDVRSGDWFMTAVEYVVHSGMMAGTSSDSFSPDKTLTRGMLAQVLYNFDEDSRSGMAGLFRDVISGQWYADAVNWTAARGIMSGYGDTFGPEDPITREQLAVTLFNYSGIKGYDLSGRTSLTRFPDADQTSSWAVSAMEWAVGNGLFAGKDGFLAPKGNATRAEVASVLMNFCENIAK